MACGLIKEKILKPGVRKVIKETLGNIPEPEHIHNRLFRPGIYDFYFKIEVKSNESNSWIPVKSNIVSLSIMQPSGKEKEAYDKWINISKPEKRNVQTSFFDNFSQLRSNLVKIIDTFPNSTYSNYARYKIGLICLSLPAQGTISQQENNKINCQCALEYFEPLLEKQNDFIYWDEVAFKSAYCYSVLGKGNKAVQLNQRIVNECPESPYAERITQNQILWKKFIGEK